MAVSVKMGVDITQFKQGMQQAQQSAKTLNAQMKANEAQYKATGDKEKYLAEQTKLLKAQMDAQKTAAANAQKALDAMTKNGVSETSAEYQKMATQLANATAAMYNAQSAMDSLTASEQNAAAGAGNMSTALSNISKQVSFDAINRGIDKITTGLANAAKKAVEVGQNVWESILDTAAYADDIATMAAQLQLTTDEVQRMQYVAGQFEAPVATIGRAWKKIKMDMSSGSEEVAEAFRELGVATHDVIPTKYGQAMGDARDYRDVFWETGEAIMQMTDAAEQERYAQKLLGRSWEELIPLFTAGRDAYEAALEAAPAASDAAVQAAADLNDRMQQLEDSWNTLKLEAIGKLAPALSTAADAIKGLLDSLTEYLQTDAGQQMMQNLGDAVSNLLTSLLDIDTGDLINMATSAVEGLTGALNWFTDNKDTIIPVMEGMAIAFGAIKAASGAAAMINALRNLFGTKGTGGLGGNQTVGSENVTTQNVSNLNITGSTTFAGATTFTDVVSETITTSHVTTMHVGTLINGSPTNPTTPTTPTNPTTPITFPTNPVTYITNGGSSLLGGLIGGGAGAAITAGAITHAITGTAATGAITGATTAGLLGAGTGVTNAIILDASEYAITEAATDATIAAAGKVASTIAPKVIGGIATALAIILTPGETAGNLQDQQRKEMLQEMLGERAGTTPSWMDDPTMVAAVNALWQAELDDTKDYDTALAAFNSAFENDPEAKQQIINQMRDWFNSQMDEKLLNWKIGTQWAQVYPWLMPSRTGYGVSEMTTDQQAAEMAYSNREWANGMAQQWAIEDLYDLVQRWYGRPGTVVGGDSLWDLLNNGDPIVLGDEFSNAVWENARANLTEDQIQEILELFHQYAAFVGPMSELEGEVPANVPETLWRAIEQALNGGDGEGVEINVLPELSDDAKDTTQKMVNEEIGTVKVPAVLAFGSRYNELIGTVEAPGHANGLWNVPWDGYPAILHRGERVLTARENQQYTYNNYFGNVNLNNGLEIEALTESIDRRNRRQRSGYGA